MGDHNSSISPQTLVDLVGTAACPRLFDVRRAAAWAEAEDLIPTATWRDHKTARTWGADLPAGSEIAGSEIVGSEFPGSEVPGSEIPGSEIVVYCVHGHQVSQSAAALLRSLGLRARFLEGGIEAYREAGGPLLRKAALPGGEEVRPGGRPSRWVTRDRPKIDRVACPWLIRRFLDREAEIHFVESDWVEAAATELEAIPFDIPGVAFSHEGALCSFDAFLEAFGLRDPALDRVALIVRGADTGHPELAPEASGLLALSLGLSAIEGDDLALLERGFLLYDALYGWARHAARESHGWPPAEARKAS